MTAPPKIMPTNMAIDVPDWNNALPDMSSFGFRISGKMAYLMGPKKVECVPIINRAKSSSHKLPNKKPAEPMSIITISRTLMPRMSCERSNLSAICPAVAENMK